jgi:dolichol-phosphate mannosyltransferase
MTAAAEKSVGDSYELILVNDGSRDDTWLIIKELINRFPGIVGSNLARNHGHQLAVTAGLSLCTGDRVLIIDADLQDPPELLGSMMARMDEGYDVVYGKRRNRRGETRFKLLTARLFYRSMAALTETPIPLDSGDFRVMSRRIVDRLNAMPERDRFIRGMVSWLGGRQTELLYDRDPRATGETKFSLFRMLHFAIDGLTSFSMVPLRIASAVGLLGVVTALGLGIYTVVGFLAGHTIVGWTSLALIVVFFSTAQLLSLAVIGEYLGRTYMQSKGRPLYIIDEIVAGRPHRAFQVHSERNVSRVSDE